MAHCRLAVAPRCVHLELIALAALLISYVPSMSALKHPKGQPEAIQDGAGGSPGV